MLSQNFIFGEGESVKAVFTNLNPNLKRSYTQISGNKNSNPIPIKKLRLGNTNANLVISSPLKRNHRDIYGNKNSGGNPEKRGAISMPLSEIDGIDTDNPNIWLNRSLNDFGEEIVSYSDMKPIFKNVNGNNDHIFEASDSDGVKLVFISNGGSGWVQNRDVIWTND